jgi:hypothetical protein
VVAAMRVRIPQNGLDVRSRDACPDFRYKK